MAAIPLVEKVRAALQPWRKDYRNVGPVTRRLLEFWFQEEHFLADGTEFRFYEAQREAIESLIYLYEVCGYKNLYDLARNLNVSLTFDPTTDNWPKYCFKMATGSGKTFVMALAMVWQYFNHFFHTDDGRRYSSSFVLIAPNLIVLDRLYGARQGGKPDASSFADSAIFKNFPFIPPEWNVDFDLQVIYQSQVRPVTGRGVLYLTNVQQLYAVPEEKTLNALGEALGPGVVRGESLGREDLQEALQHHDNLVVLNDEAHHVHSDDLEWSKAIENLHQGCLARQGDGLTMQLDFTATPYVAVGSTKRYFPHIICDYPLAAAIRDQVVKRPKIGEIENAPEPATKDYVKKNRLQIDTGVEILRRFQKDLKKIGKKPVLFLMCDVTRNADKVGTYLETEHRLPTLVIHTDARGVITKKDLESRRDAARDIDTNEFQAIVSVMMLKEGWDVKNVCVVVPLRSYDSPILAEQTLGRGLRRMSACDSGWEEKLVVIDHPRFRDLWQAEIENEDLEIEITGAGQVYEPLNVVRVDPKKMRYDMEIPVLMGGLKRSSRRLDDLDIRRLPQAALKWSETKLPKVMYREKDLLTQRTDLEKELAFDYTDRADLYLTFVTKAILGRCAATAHFSALFPKVRTYVQNGLFDTSIDLNDADTVKRLNHVAVRERIVDTFVEAINQLDVDEEPYTLEVTFRVSQVEPFHTSEPVYMAKKTVFEQLPYPKTSEYEKRFMKYMDGQGDVEAYTKTCGPIPLRIFYRAADGRVASYRPDFWIRAKNGHVLLETKGKGWDQQEDVKHKVAAAIAWCEGVQELTRKPCMFIKILDSDFSRFAGLSFLQLLKAVR